MDANFCDNPLTRDEAAFVRTFLRVVTVLPRLLDADLEAQHRISLSEFGVLMLVAEAGDNNLRMSELAEMNALSLSGISRIVSRLEGKEMVYRCKHHGDRRNAYVAITEDGMAALKLSYPAYLASLRTHLLQHLASQDLPSLSAALAGVGADKLCQE